MKKKITLAMLAVATAYMLQASLNVLNPIVATISTIFPGIPYETVALAATLPTLLAIPGGLIADRIVARLGYKQTLILLYILMIVSGILPAFFSGSFAMLLVSRAIFGLAYGIAYPLCAMAVRAFFAPEQHGQVMGLGEVFLNIGNILFSLLAGWAAAINWTYALYVHFVLAIPLILAFFLGKPVQQEKPQNPEKSSAKPAEKPRMNGTCWFYAIAISLTTMFYYAYFVYSSGILMEKDLGGSAEAGYLITGTAVAGILAGSLFPKLYAKLGGKIYSLAALVVAAGYLLLVFAGNYAMMLISALLMGFSFHLFLPAAFSKIGSACGSAADRTTGMTSSLMNLFSFLATYIFTFLAGIVGQRESLTVPFFFAVGYFVLTGILYLFRRKEA